MSSLWFGLAAIFLQSLISLKLKLSLWLRYSGSTHFHIIVSVDNYWTQKWQQDLVNNKIQHNLILCSHRLMTCKHGIYNIDLFLSVYPIIGNNYFNDISPMYSPLWCTLLYGVLTSMVYPPLWCTHLYAVLTSMIYSPLWYTHPMMYPPLCCIHLFVCTHHYDVLTSLLYSPLWCTHLYGVVRHIL